MGSLVSLVMSDIVDSTRRWNAAEGAMAADLELHDRLIREVVEGAGGSVFKHTGDGMIAVFDDPVAAVSAAAGVQQVIGAAQWQQPDGLRVRAAVHTGVVYPRDGDLFGTAVNRVARLLGVCSPGAVLVSGATTGLLTDRAPEGLVLQRVGPVSLAGFATPDDAHALVGTGLPSSDVAASTSVVARGGVLPSIDEELVGRGEELAAIWDALGRARLVTLVGVGGMGKTRLALEVGVGAATAYRDGAWWIDLANATSAEAVVPVAMAAVEARETAGRTGLQAVCDRFVGVSGVLVVDNCEHLLAAARELIGAVRAAAPDVHVVATSREALGLRGEHIVPVGSLPVDDGVRLFGERGLAVRPDLDIDANRAVIERICARLDGIPLAIELAAARCRSMTPGEIDEVLGDRFRLLRSGREGAERHRTLQAAVAWSYSMLDPDERAVFDQMAVFAGGSLIDGLIAVTGFDRFGMLDTIDRLVARSMVVTTTTRLGTRYHQLETFRQFAEDRLVEAGTIGEVRDRHLDWVQSIAAAIGSAAGLDACAMAYARFKGEVDNMRVAVAHATRVGQHGAAQRVVSLVAEAAAWDAAWEVLDWVRPLQLEHGWTAEAATCQVLGGAADNFRTTRLSVLESPDDLPEWWPVASLPVRTHCVNLHLQSGGDWRTALVLLDRLDPRTDHELACVGASRLFAFSQRQQLEVLGEAELDELVALAAVTVSRARRTGGCHLLPYSLLMSTAALMLGRPLAAAVYGAEGVETAERLGAATWIGLCRGALALVPLAAPSSPNEVRSMRHQFADAIDRNDQITAFTLAIGLSGVVGSLEPDVVTRLWWVWRRDTSNDWRRPLATFGVAVPEDPVELANLDRHTASLSVLAASRALLDAIDRWLAAADADAAGGGDG
jgi:predicted ATPase/class 3 adenylate cyclase